MTAEIAIMNRQGIVLAADSAVTVGKERVWKHSNKLFSLGPKNDIAIMIYGGGDFCGFPWELIIKLFRAECNDKWLTVGSCGAAFIAFLSDKRFSPDNLSKISNLTIFLKPLTGLKKSLNKNLKKLEYRKNILRKCDEQIKSLQDKFPEIPDYQSFKEFKSLYDTDDVKSLVSDTLECAIPKSYMGTITSFLWEFSRRTIKSNYETGVVVAGYGKDELFPCVYEYIIDGKDENSVRAWPRLIMDSNDPSSMKAGIFPFGQSDIFHLFMEGIAPEYLRFIRRAIASLLNDKSNSIVKDYIADADEKIVETAKQNKDNSIIVEGLIKRFYEYRQTSVVQKIMRVVLGLPKEEMIEMANAMVELTSLRRKVDSPTDSVGGPVDIAVISKSDGLIWIKRKHYFDLEINRDFLYRKFGSVGGDHG